ncbi:MAG: HAMP domain-containing protein [Desulfobacterales bacterium]|nr:HAMP domain-containing protein [Desulfobacterales bacterium]
MILTNFRFKLSHKILGMVILALLISGIATIMSSLIFANKLESEVGKRLNLAFEAMFLDIKNLFNGFRDISEESVKKSSGLIALDNITNITQKGQNKFQDYTNQMIGKMGENVHTALNDLKGAMGESFDTILSSSSDTIGRIIDEANKSSDALGHMSSFRLEALAYASLDGLNKIDESLLYLGKRLVDDPLHEDLTFKFQNRIDETTMNIMTVLTELSSNPSEFSASKALELIMPFQEEIKKYIAEENKKVYEEVKNEIKRIENLIKEQMRLMDLKMKKDTENEKIISSSILNTFFEHSIADVINIQSQSKDKISKVEKVLTDEINKINTDLPKELATYGEQTKNEINKETSETVKTASLVIEKSKKDISMFQSKTAKNIEDLKTSFMLDIKEKINANMKVTLTILIVVVALGTGVFIIFFYILVKNISNPINNAVKLAENIACGDVTQQIEVKRSDEIGELLNAMAFMTKSLKNKIEIANSIASGDLTVTPEIASQKDILGKSFQSMTTNLNNMISELYEIVSQIDMSSNELASSSCSLAKASNDQASSLEEIAASITQIA